ncbi:FHA domain-containing protein [Paraneptunicella aestuarii]|uniref:FHA domain-containing protein n=1 Tax=Paraneptunicella aestuarii TaxID=2831148 RepID=UPI001E645BBA|nr:FHA domain-containing protein [Paraneptunicella aestuarii]UAA39257.1 FHA domain-containing protein [Paraneptunicella aestuarii]
MAQLLVNASQESIYLTKYHLFGRKHQVVNTYLEHPNVSRIHMLIEWKNGAWVLKDKSTNGVWLNDSRVQMEQEYPLTVGDTIVLPESTDIAFTVVDLDQPKDVLISSTESGESQENIPRVIFLDQLNLLPDELSPEIVLSYDSENSTWMCENTESMVAHPIVEGDTIHFGNNIWKFITGADQSDVPTAELEGNEALDLKYIFRISQDEELAELKIRNKDSVIDLDVRSHHYLTALLARYKKQEPEQDNGLDECLKGWVSIKQLSKDLGLNESHINIQIHRARKQLMEHCQRIGLNVPDIIERRRGYVRFAAEQFSIFKGDVLEA